MKLVSSKQYIAAVLEDHKKKALEENAVILREKKEKEEEDKKASEYYEEMVNRQSLPKRYSEFITSVKEEFLADCIYSVFNESLNVFDRRSKKQELVKKALVANFIKEQGANQLLSKFRTKNVLLSEFALIVDKAVNAVVETTNAMNINSWTIDTDIKDRFTADLKDCNSKEAIVTITDRVTDAETEFINDNMRRKLEIDEVLQAKKEKLDAMEGKPEEVKESVAASYDRKVKTIKNRHISSIYQVVAESMTKNALTDESLRPIYIKEGNLNMDTVLEDAGIIYTFLETLSTTEMVDEAYIKKFVNEI